MRVGRIVAALAVLPLMLGGCGGSPTPAYTEPPPGEPWVMVAPGSATPSVRPKAGPALKPALPPVSFLPLSTACVIGWQEKAKVLIPMVVTVGTASLTVQWPNRYGNTYRLTAVPQELVSGAQPEPPWQTITTGAECEVTATIGGLTSGKAYIVWLDAPNTPRGVDGGRALYSGKSAVVIPN